MSQNNLPVQQLPDAPHDIVSMLPAAYSWMKQFGILSEWHLNSIIITILTRSKYARNVEMDIDVNHKSIRCYIIVSPMTLWLKKRQESILAVARDVFMIYAPAYEVKLGFKFGKKRST